MFSFDVHLCASKRLSILYILKPFLCWKVVKTFLCSLQLVQISFLFITGLFSLFFYTYILNLCYILNIIKSKTHIILDNSILIQLPTYLNSFIYLQSSIHNLYSVSQLMIYLFHILQLFFFCSIYIPPKMSMGIMGFMLCWLFYDKN